MTDPGYIDYENDFGFTHVGEPDLPVSDLEQRLDKMYAAIDALLKNLEQNPDQELIRWPNRAQKIHDFRLKLQQIRNGDL